MQIGRGRCKCRGGKLADRFLFANCDLAAINKKTLVATPYTFSPSYAQAVSAGMATAGADGVGSGENGTEGAGIGGRGYGAGRGGVRTGGGGSLRGGRHGYCSGYGYDDGANYNGPRFSPNFGTYLPNYGPGWEYDRGRRGRYGGGSSTRGWNGGFRQSRNFQRYNQQRVPPQGSIQQHQNPQVPNQQLTHSMLLKSTRSCRVQWFKQHLHNPG
jgi:hypothetical protein